MALGFNKKSHVVDAPPLANAPEVKHTSADYNAAQTPAYDTENQGARKMSRIDKSITKPITGGDPDLSDDSSGMSIGKQMEMEAGNAIKYRTCSWPKV